MLAALATAPGRGHCSCNAVQCHARAGWPAALVAPTLLRLLARLQSHTVGPCSLSQVVTAATLEAWGEEGLDAHLRRVQAEYARRAAVILAACHQVGAWAARTGEEALLQ